MIITVVTIFIFVLYALLIFYYRQAWLQIPVRDNIITKEAKKLTTNLSVIIPARNEEKNIHDCLQSIVSQSYPKQLFEVIVIDDHSTDATAEIIKSFSDKNVSLLSLKDYTENESLNSYKKKALEIAISKATGQLIVTTDADCVAPHGWLKTIAAFYEKYNPVFIAAPVTYFVSTKGEGFWTRVLKIFQSLDFMTLQGITGASVYKKFHSMCNGANLAYERKVFYEVDGFKRIDTIASGDDMLLMHKIYKKYPDKVLFLKSRNAIIKTSPMDTLTDFFNQRIRWASKADKYTDKKITLVLALVYLFNAWILALGIASFFFHFIFYLFLTLLFAKTICELIFLYPVAKFFDKEKMLWWFPVLQPFHIIYTIIAGWLGKFGTYKWKERKVK
jgi:cellulose synthase/poly-beta-1,6-N-acetylglucosamine synthase-like glycosyltransferase